MKSMTARQKLFAIVAGGVIAFAVILFFGIKPFLADLEILHTEVGTKKEDLNKLLAEEAGYKQARSDLTRIRSRVDQIESLFPGRVQLVTFVEKLESIADTFDNEFTITITDPAENVTGDSRASRRQGADSNEYQIVPGLKDIEVIPYSIVVEGDFLSMVQFLQSFEHQPFYSEIDSLQLTSVVGSSQASGQVLRSGSIEATISAAFYAKKED